MGAFTNNDDDIIASINITPFVDVVLVLLVALMLTSAQIVKSAIEVELPKAANGGQSVAKTINVVIGREGQLALDGNPIASDILAPELRQVKKDSADLQVVISADRLVPYEKVIRVVDIVKSVGISTFALNVDRSTSANDKGRE